MRFICKEIPLFLLALMLVQPLPAQRRQVDIVHADAIKGMKRGEENISRLIGNVKLYHNATTMTCDSAYSYPDNRFEAFGNVVVNKDTLWLYGDYMDYQSSTDMGKVRGKLVTLFDGATRLRTQHLDFNTSTNEAIFYSGGTIDKATNLLESDRGRYLSDRKLAIFYDKVEMKNEEYRLKSDSLHFFTEEERAVFFRQTYIWSDSGFLAGKYGYYDKRADHVFLAKNAYVQSRGQEAWSDSAHYYRSVEEGELFGNIQLYDSAQHVMVFGDYAKLYQATQQAFVTENPSAALFSDKVEDDTMFFRADTLKLLSVPNPLYYAQDTLPAADSISSDSILQHVAVADSIRPVFADTVAPTAADTAKPDSLLRFFVAYPEVRFFHPQLQGRCDSFVYIQKDSLAEMFYDPVLWNQNNQLSAEKIEILQKNNQIHTMELMEAAFITAVDDSLKQFYNQIKGINILARFRNNDLYKIDVYGSGQTVYYMREGIKLSGVNKASSTDMEIFVKNRKIQKINYISNPESTILPPKQIEVQELMLKGFSWRSTLRPPTRQSVCSRVVVPSFRAESAAIPLPLFTITKRIDELKNTNTRFVMPGPYANQLASQPAAAPASVAKPEKIMEKPDAKRRQLNKFKPDNALGK
ncbi:MAG: hypothetical protein LBK47_10805 [Prevotellaceae bacterium]|jgi:lipopolysaccharide export system protein LptA|nr:hypothetical protein [Prevotellaceae bacterium]